MKIQMMTQLQTLTQIMLEKPKLLVMQERSALSGAGYRFVVGRSGRRLLTLLLLLLVPAFSVWAAGSPFYVRQWGAYGQGNGQFAYPVGVTVDSSGYVYVTDVNNSRIQQFTSTGDYVRQWGTKGSGNGQFDAPSGVAVDSRGYVYVADITNNRIQQFTSTGDYVRQWGTKGSGNGQFMFPYGMAVDSHGYVYVADIQNSRIQQFTSTGDYVRQWGSGGSGNGQFNHPYGVAVDSSSNVYVADTQNNRIQQFTSTGDYVTQWGSQGSDNGQFAGPINITVDNSGQVYVVDYGNSRIQQFTSTGDYVTQWGSKGSDNGQFMFPYGMAVDSSGNFYVADTYNHRIQQFGRDTDPPVVTVSFTPNGQNGWFTTNPAVGQVTAQDASRIKDIRCSNALVSDLAGIGTTTASATLSVRGEGTLTNVTCWATDSAGQDGAAVGSSNQTTVLIDTLAPDTTITAQPINLSKATTASFDFNGADSVSPVLRYQCQLDSGNWTDCTSPKSYTGLSDGPHTFQVQAIDQAGNADATPASDSWTIDATAPTVTINQAADQADPTSSSPVHFTVIFNEAVTGFTDSDVTLNGTAGATIAVVMGSGTTYDVAVSGMTSGGTVIASIPANEALDAVGNGNTASTSTDNSVVFTVIDATAQVGKTRTALSFDRTANGVATLGTYTLVFDYVNNTGHSLRNIYYQVTTVNNAYLMNADGGPGQVGAQQTVANSALPGGDSVWQTSETLSGQTHLVGVAGKAWSLTIAIYAVDATARSSEPQLLDTLTFDSTQFPAQGQTLFLPLIKR